MKKTISLIVIGVFLAGYIQTSYSMKAVPAIIISSDKVAFATGIICASLCCACLPIQYIKTKCTRERETADFNFDYISINSNIPAMQRML